MLLFRLKFNVSQVFKNSPIPYWGRSLAINRFAPCVIRGLAEFELDHVLASEKHCTKYTTELRQSSYYHLPAPDFWDRGLIVSFSQSLSAAAAFGYSNHVNLSWQLGILTMFCLAGSYSFWCVEWKCRCSGNDFEEDSEETGGLMESYEEE